MYFNVDKHDISLKDYKYLITTEKVQVQAQSKLA